MVAAKCDSTSSCAMFPRKYQYTTQDMTETYGYDPTKNRFWVSKCKVAPKLVLGGDCVMICQSSTPCSFAFKLEQWQYA
jgi:hypothetical protein